MLSMGLGNLLYVKGDREQAAQVFESLLEQHPFFAPAHNNLAEVLLALGHHEAATVHARIAVQLGGAYLEIYQSTLDATRLTP
jgi:tetratricopeptide (TPR) repeat protein